MPYIHPTDDVPTLSSPSAEEFACLAHSSPASLRIFDYSLDTLEPLKPLQGLLSLALLSVRCLTSLSGLEHLTSLTSLIISTPPTWDGRGKYIEVDSYSPISKLRKLQSLVITGIRPRDLTLEAIRALPSLKMVEIAHVPDFTVKEFATLAAHLPQVESRVLMPYFAIPGVATCKRCGQPKVFLNGSAKGSRKTLCPQCNGAALEAHVAEWTRYKAAAGLPSSNEHGAQEGVPGKGRST